MDTYEEEKKQNPGTPPQLHIVTLNQHYQHLKPSFTPGKETHEQLINGHINTRNHKHLPFPLNRLRHSCGWRFGSIAPTALSIGLLTFFLLDGITYFTNRLDTFYDEYGGGASASQHEADVTTMTHYTLLSFMFLVLSAIGIGVTIRYTVDEEKYQDSYKMFAPKMLKTSSILEEYDMKHLLDQLIKHSTYLLTTRHGPKALALMMASTHQHFSNPESPEGSIRYDSDSEEDMPLAKSPREGLFDQERFSGESKSESPSPQDTPGAPIETTRSASIIGLKHLSQQELQTIQTTLAEQHSLIRIVNSSSFDPQKLHVQFTRGSDKLEKRVKQLESALNSLRQSNGHNFLARLEQLENQLTEISGQTSNHQPINQKNFMALWMFALRQHMSNNGVNLSPKARAKFLHTLLQSECFTITESDGTKTLTNSIELGKLMQIFFDFCLVAHSPEQTETLSFKKETQADITTFLHLSHADRAAIVESITDYTQNTPTQLDSKNWEELMAHAYPTKKSNCFFDLFKRKKHKLPYRALGQANPELRQSLINKGQCDSTYFTVDT